VLGEKKKEGNKMNLHLTVWSQCYIMSCKTWIWKIFCQLQASVIYNHSQDLPVKTWKSNYSFIFKDQGRLSV